MMAAAGADNDCKGRQRQRRMAMACKIGWQPIKGTDKSGRQETAETRSGNDGCRGARWWRWMTTVVDDDNGDGGDNNSDGGRRQQQTTTAANDDGTQDWAADYKGEGEERAANNNGIRAHRAESVKK